MTRVARLLTALAARSVRHPRRTLVAALAAFALALAGAGAGLTLKTSNLDLIDPGLPEVKRFRDVAAEFGTPNALVVVFEGGGEAALAAAVERMAPRLATVRGVRAVIDRTPLGPGVSEVLGLDPYLTSRDKGLFFVFVQPEDPHSSADTLAPLVTDVRRALDEVGLEDLGVRAGLTGMPAYAIDDREVVRRDVSTLSLVAFVLVLALFTAAFRSFRRPAMAMAALAVGVGVTLGAVAVFPGHLTLLSAFFASILFGLGVDFGIHLISRVEELTAAGAGEKEAAVAAVASLARPLATGAFTTASVFFAMGGSGFRGFEELGVIAGLGVVCCLLAAITVLPALLALFPSPAAGRPPGARWLGRALAVVSRPVAVALVAAVAVAGAALGGPGFDTDYLNLEPRGSEAVRLEREMVRRSDWSPELAVFTAGSRERLKELVWELANDDTVGAVRSIRDLEVGGLAGARPEVPDAFLSLFQSAAGRYAVYAYPAGDVWDPGEQAAFLAHMRAIDSGVTGMPFLGSFMVDRSRRALRVTAALGGALLALWVAAHFRRLGPSVLAALPTVLTVTSLHALMRLFGLSYNPLNVMALPVVLGIAVDDGVHLVHRFLAERGDLERTLAGTGRSVVLTSATTLAAFGSLVFTSHRGLASFALTLTLGVASALVISVVVLPQLLRLLPARPLGLEVPHRSIVNTPSSKR